MRAIILAVASIAGPLLVFYAFRFSPDKLYLVACLLASLASWRSIHLYLLRHWMAHPERVRAVKLNPAHVAFQATVLAGGLFFALCFVTGMLITTMLGSSTVERGNVISSHGSRGCTKVTVMTEKAGVVSLCMRTPYGIGSAIAVKVRRSWVGRYVE